MRREWSRRKHGITVASGVFVLIVGLSVAVPTSASAAPGNPSSVDYQKSLADNDRARQLAEDLEARLGAASNYAGIRITPSGIEVLTVGSPTLAEGEAVTSATSATKSTGTTPTDTVPVTFRQVGYPLSELTSITQRLDADSAELAAGGIRLSSWGPVQGDNRVVVHLEQYSDTAAQQLEARYGPAVSVAVGNEKAAAGSRTADSAPWYGGDLISHNDGATTWNCTSWFSATRSGSAVAATSGHRGSGAWKQNGNAFGNTSALHFGGSMDGQIIPVASNSGYVWADPGATTRVVKAVASSDPEGSSFCTDGNTNREVCGAYVYATNQSVSYDGQTITGLVYGVKENGQAAWSPGNSGGPVYTIGSTGITATGMIEAYVVGGENMGWYMPARTVQSYFGLTVKPA